jgi:hypothetical protein
MSPSECRPSLSMPRRRSTTRSIRCVPSQVGPKAAIDARCVPPDMVVEASRPDRSALWLRRMGCKEGGKRSPVGEAYVIAEELQAVVLMRRDQHFEKPAPEQARKHPSAQGHGRLDPLDYGKC